MKAYRIENQREQHGLWRDFEGNVNPVFSQLSVGKCRNLPMEDNEFYRYNGEKWFSATDEPWKMRAWFDVADVVELEELGYNLYEFDIQSCRTVSEFEIVFTRADIIQQRLIDPATIWTDYMVYKTQRGHNHASD